MGAISTWLTSMRTRLAAAPASLKNLPAAGDIKDLPASKLHKGFRLITRGGERLGAEHGGGTLIEKFVTAELEIHWDPELDKEGLSNTISDDMANANAVMLKDSYKTSGIVLVKPEIPLAVNDDDPNDVFAIGTYEVRFREAIDLT